MGVRMKIRVDGHLSFFVMLAFAQEACGNCPGARQATVVTSPSAPRADFDAAADSGRSAASGPESPPFRECGADGWCWENPLPNGHRFRSIWGGATDDVWAVGDGSVVMHWDGRDW